MDSKEGRQIHAEAEHLREGGKLEEAIVVIKRAEVVYIRENDLLGAAEALASEVLVWRHLGEREGKKEFLMFAEMAAKLSVEMAEKSGLKEATALPYHTLGKVYEDLGKWTEAAVAQSRAIEVMISNPPRQHNRPAYINEMRIHWLVDRYMGGEKDVLPELNKVLAELESDIAEPKYNRDVWLSGGFMSKAKMLKSDNPEEARKAFLKAGEIIKSNPDLKLRREQWDKMAIELKS